MNDTRLPVYNNAIVKINEYDGDDDDGSTDRQAGKKSIFPIIMPYPGQQFKFIWIRVDGV